MSDQTPDQSDPYADLRRTLPDATPGPWRLNRDGDTALIPMPAGCSPWQVIPPSSEDASYIAAANPATIGRLLAERDALAAEVARVRFAVGDLADCLKAEADAEPGYDHLAAVDEIAESAEALVRMVSATTPDPEGPTQ